MMVETKTRTQRRMERKQALTLLVLVLIVSLCSFTLGVVVGRRGAERDMAQYAEPRRIMVAEVPNSQPVTASTSQEEGSPAEEEKLTFYDNLSRDEAAPLGSGINLPPKKEPVKDSPPLAKPVDAKVQSPAKEMSVAPVKKQTPVVASTLPAKIPSAVANGNFSVQVGSFSSVADAGRFKKSLVAKGYPTFIAEADLGSRGIWYRVRLGPYADANGAKKAMQIADQKDNIKGFVSRL